MINNAADYQFVTGITGPDAILIDGDIMPQRDVNDIELTPDVPVMRQARCLRGEDIAFLYEAFYEREAMFLRSTSGLGHSFSKTVSSSQVRNLMLLLRFLVEQDGVTATGCGTYVANDFAFGASYRYDGIVAPTLRELIPSAAVRASTLYTDPARHSSAIEGDNIRRMYADLKRLDRMWLPLVMHSECDFIESHYTVRFGTASPPPPMWDSHYIYSSNVLVHSGSDWGQYAYTSRSSVVEIDRDSVTCGFDRSTDALAMSFCEYNITVASLSGGAAQNYEGTVIERRPMSTVNGRLTFSTQSNVHSIIGGIVGAPLTGRQGDKICAGSIVCTGFCPVVYLGDHTDISEIPWDWTPET